MPQCRKRAPTHGTIASRWNASDTTQTGAYTAQTAVRQWSRRYSNVLPGCTITCGRPAVTSIKTNGKEVPHYALTISVPVEHRQTFGNLCTQLHVPKLPTTNFRGESLMGSPMIRPLNPLPEGAGPQAERTLTVNASMTVYDTALQGATNRMDAARRCAYLITRFVREAARASDDADEALGSAFLRMWEFHRIGRLKNSEKLTIMFVAPDAIQVLQAAGQVILWLPTFLHTCSPTGALSSAEAAMDSEVLFEIIKQAADRGKGILMNRFHLDSKQEVEFRTHDGKVATYNSITNSPEQVMSIGRSVPLQDFALQDLMKMFRKGSLRLNLHMVTTLDTIAVALGMVYSNKLPKTICVQSQRIHLSFPVYALSGPSPPLASLELGLQAVIANISGIEFSSAPIFAKTSQAEVRTAANTIKKWAKAQPPALDIVVQPPEAEQAEEEEEDIFSSPTPMDTEDAKGKGESPVHKRPNTGKGATKTNLLVTTYPCVALHLCILACIPCYCREVQSAMQECSRPIQQASVLILKAYIRAHCNMLAIEHAECTALIPPSAAKIDGSHIAGMYVVAMLLEAPTECHLHHVQRAEANSIMLGYRNFLKGDVGNCQLLRYPPHRLRAQPSLKYALHYSNYCY